MTSATHGWIHLRGLRIEGVRLGIHPHERDAPRLVIVDVALWTPVAPAAASERIEDALDYDQVAALLREVSRRRYYPLVESLCEKLAAALLDRFGVERVQVEVTKPDVLAPGSVSIAVERAR